MEFSDRVNLVIVLLATSGMCVLCQFSHCPQDATSCCQCVTIPGCAWSPPPDNSSEPWCHSISASWDRLVNDLEIPQRSNRPLNPNRNRLVRPQSGKLTMALGLRKEIPIQVLAKTARVRLAVTSFVAPPEFSIEKGSELSCSRRFRLRERIYTPRSSSRRRHRNNGTSTNSTEPRHKRVYVDCVGSGPGEVHSLRLIVDMNRCYKSKRQIRITVRERRARKFRLDVKSACDCPCMADEEPEIESDRGEECPGGEHLKQCVSGENQGSGNHCSGVNDYCRREQNEQACSGHGTCICGVCMCDVIHPEIGYEEPIPGIVLDGAVTPPQQRYTGVYCQCDDMSCPRFDDMICGGPARGRCRCGDCVCREGFSGDSCGVVLSNETCRAPDGSVCSNRGMCISGHCVCTGENTGMFCELCPTCRGMCSRLAPCIECLSTTRTETPDDSQNQCSAVCSLSNAPPMMYTPSDGEWPESADFCVTRRNTCHYEFAYLIQNSGDMVVYYKNERHCSGEVIQAA